MADFDDDGDVDLAVAINRGQPLLLRNDTQTNHRFLKVILRGPPSACFGAKVEVICRDQRQVQWYGADVSYLSMHAPELLFGLGTSRSIDRIQVHWADGQQSVVTAVAVSSRVVVQHPDGGRIVTLSPERDKG